MIKVTALHIYPIKSGHPLELDKSLVVKSGLENDRILCIADEQGHILTGRTHPKLLKIRGHLNDQKLKIDYENQSSLSIDLNQQSGYKYQLLMFKKNVISAVALDKSSSDWISNCLGISCTLYNVDLSEPRQIKPKYAPHEGDFITFTDALPILLSNESSLADLNSRLYNAIGMNRFRPNITVDGALPFAEDSWKYISIGDCEFEVIKGCKRCVFTTVDPETYTKDKNTEPLKTLSTFRKREDGIYFGIYLIPRKLGQIKKGDTVELIK